MANFYFLILLVLELYPPVTDSPGYPGLLLPLSFVMGLSMLKDLYEDIQRHRSDNRENNSKAEVGKTFKKKKKKQVTLTHKFVHKKWKDIRVGQILRVYENQYFPCDLVLINSSMPKGIAYVETKNLDGETNLKHKKTIPNCIPLASTDEDVITKFQESEIECDMPNAFIYKFQGRMTIDGT